MGRFLVTQAYSIQCTNAHSGMCWCKASANVLEQNDNLASFYAHFRSFFSRFVFSHSFHLYVRMKCCVFSKNGVVISLSLANLFTTQSLESNKRKGERTNMNVTFILISELLKYHSFALAEKLLWISRWVNDQKSMSRLVRTWKKPNKIIRRCPLYGQQDRKEHMCSERSIKSSMKFAGEE